jgi:hypothetical protein
MTKYFFDLRSGNILSRDEEGFDLPDLQEVHCEAVGALVDAVEEVVTIGQSEQRFSIEVRDELGPVLEVTAVLGSKILRKQ